MRRYLYFFISFFSFIGYYVGLELIISIGMITLSRFYTIPLRLLLTIVMIFLILKLRAKLPSSKQLFLVLFWFFWIFYFMAIIRALADSSIEYYKSPAEIFLYAIVYCVIPFIFFTLDMDDRARNTYKNGLIASGFLLAIFTYQLYGSLVAHGVSRIDMAKYTMGRDFVSISPLALSYASSMIVAICLYYILFTKPAGKIKIYYGLTAILSMIPFFLGASRGSVIALTFSLGFIVFYQKSLKVKIWGIVFLLIVGAAVVYFANYFGSGVISRLLSLMDDVESGNSSASRLNYWQGAWAQFLKSPVWGDSIQSDIPPYPHNIFLEVLMSVGILGFIPFFGLLWLGFKRSIEIVRYQKQHVWMVIIFIQGLMQSLFSGSVNYAIFYWAGLGLVFSVKKNRGIHDNTAQTNQMEGTPQEQRLAKCDEPH